jgi:hypothetical protein
MVRRDVIKPITFISCKIKRAPVVVCERLCFFGGRFLRLLFWFRSVSLCHTPVVLYLYRFTFLTNQHQPSCSSDSCPTCLSTSKVETNSVTKKVCRTPTFLFLSSCLLRHIHLHTNMSLFCHQQY